MSPAGHIPRPGTNRLHSPSSIGYALALAPTAGHDLLASAQRLRVDKFPVRFMVLQAACHIEDESGELASAVLGAIYTMPGDALVVPPAGLPRAGVNPLTRSDAH